MHAEKTKTAIAFNFLDSTYRVGFHTMNTPSTNYVDVKDFLPGAGLQRNTWYSKLFGVTIGTGLTPTLNSMLRVGELFRTGAGGSGILVPASTFPEGPKKPVSSWRCRAASIRRSSPAC